MTTLWVLYFGIPSTDELGIGSRLCQTPRGNNSLFGEATISRVGIWQPLETCQAAAVTEPVGTSARALTSEVLCSVCLTQDTSPSAFDFLLLWLRVTSRVIGYYWPRRRSGGRGEVHVVSGHRLPRNRGCVGRTGTTPFGRTLGGRNRQKLPCSSFESLG